MNDSLFRRTGSQDFSKFLKVMVSGPPKSGKTTLLGTVPNLLVLDTEPHANNLESIAHLDIPYATITSSDDLRHAAMVLGNDSLRQQLARDQYGIADIQGVAIDTLDTLQKILKNERLKEQRSTQFQRDDWGWLKAEMEAIVEMFTALPMHVFFMVHVKTKDIGRGDATNTVVLPGLEGAIAESIAGMVGYSLLSFREEEVAPDGSKITKYYLRTEGDSTYDFLGTRTAGRLPSVIAPDMATIYNTVMANRPKAAPAVAAPPAVPQPTLPQAPIGEAANPTPSAAPTQDASGSPLQGEEVAQNAGRDEGVQTAVETRPTTPEPEQSAAAPAATEPPPAEKPDNDAPISPAAVGHVKRVFNSLEIAFPTEIVEESTMGDARTLVKYWQAVQQDHAEGKGMPGVSPQGEMLEWLNANGWIPVDGPGEPEVEKQIVGKVDGTIAEVEQYVRDGDGVNLEKVQEAYDLESEKGDGARASLMKKLEGFGAKPAAAPVAPTPEVQTPVETPAPAQEAPVTPPSEPVDTPVTEDEATKAVEEGLGGTVIAEGINANSPCEVCGGKLDDLDLAELGLKRFSKLLCVNDYLAEVKKK